MRNMARRGRMGERALPLELLIVLFFFAICSAVVFQCFISVREGADRAAKESELLSLAQQESAVLALTKDMESALTGAGYSQNGDVWEREADGVRFGIEAASAQTRAGTLRDMTLTVSAGELSVSLPYARYISNGGQAA